MAATYRDSIGIIGSDDIVTVDYSTLVHAAGDLLVLHVFGYASLGPIVGATLTWTMRLSYVSANAAWIHRIYTATSDGTSDTFTIAHGADNQYGYFVMSVSDADTNNPVDGTSVNGAFHNATANPTAPSITTTNINTLLISAVGDWPQSNVTANFTPPGGMVEREDMEGWDFYSIATESLGAAGATGTRAFTESPALTGFEGWIASSITIKSTAYAGTVPKSQYMHSADTARFTAAIRDVYYRPRTTLTSGRPPIVYCGGAGDDAFSIYNYDFTLDLLRMLSGQHNASYPIVIPTITGLWGNSTSDTRIANAITYCKTYLGAADVDPVLIGTSMGGLTALSYAIDHSVQCVVGVIPVVDLTYVRNNNIGGLQTPINSAWGLSGTTAFPANVDPALYTGVLASTPIQLWYASDDTISTNISTFASATGAELYSVGALGHTAAAMAAVDEQAVVDFVIEATTGV